MPPKTTSLTRTSSPACWMRSWLSAMNPDFALAPSPYPLPRGERKKKSYPLPKRGEDKKEVSSPSRVSVPTEKSGRATNAREPVSGQAPKEDDKSAESADKEPARHDLLAGEGEQKSVSTPEGKVDSNAKSGVNIFNT